MNKLTDSAGNAVQRTCSALGSIFAPVLQNPMFWLAVIYLIVPVDIIPDAVPAAGTLDDLLPFVLALIVQARKGSR